MSLLAFPMPYLSKSKGILSSYWEEEEWTPYLHMHQLIAIVGVDIIALSVHLSVHYFIQYLSSTYYMPGTVL